ncbi:hypothetical protein M9978_02465 [Sphingomonas sp. MG17]|uniref:Uncharacterized protein n=1 Tax=Sphingomonas tagetis TaxID=2949092 RepID=A0A9X2KK04_9SPHN|nr:hypothetical protein [Sphingomonas tagetis]MCP3729280.1 hypothetical protein [Sphingomonas tagetis]
MAWGWAAIGVGAVLLAIGLLMPVLSDAGSAGYGGYGYRPPTVNTWKWPMTLVGGGLVNFGVLLVITGYIVRALYFLPGRNVSLNDLGPAAPTNAVGPTPSSAERIEDEKKTDRIMWLLLGGIGVVFAVLFIIFAARQ